MAMRRERVQVGREMPQLDEGVVIGNQPIACSRKGLPTVLKPDDKLEGTVEPRLRNVQEYYVFVTTLLFGYGCKLIGSDPGCSYQKAQRDRGCTCRKEIVHPAHVVAPPKVLRGGGLTHRACRACHS